MVKNLLTFPCENDAAASQYHLKEFKYLHNEKPHYE